MATKFISNKYSLFPIYILPEWFTIEDDKNVIFVGLRDTKNNCLLDFEKHPKPKTENIDEGREALRIMMRDFINSLIDNGVI